jgi:hypothetical protein
MGHGRDESMNTASDSTASSTKRAWHSLFHTVTTDDSLPTTGANSATSSERLQSGTAPTEVATVAKSAVALPHIPSPLRSPAQDASYWRQSGQAFRVDRGHILGGGQPSVGNVDLPSSGGGNSSPPTGSAAAVAPVNLSSAATVKADVAVPAPTRPISPSEISPRSLPAQTPESPQIEQIAEYLRRRQTEIANQHKDLSNIARQHHSQLQQQQEIRQQRAELLRRRLELSVENLRLRLLALGEQMSQQIVVTSPLFAAFEEACETFHELKATVKEFKV